MQMTHVIAEMGSGGGEAVVVTLARNSWELGHGVAVASNGGWRTADLQCLGIRLVPLPLRGRCRPDLMRAVRALRRELVEHPTDLIHAHNVKAAAVAATAARTQRRRTPLVVTLHGVPTESYRAAGRVLRACADQLVAVSGDVAGAINAAGFPAARTTVIENAVAPAPAHARSDARARLDLPADVKVAVCVARFEPPKRHDLIVTAWERMPTDALLVLVGDGSTRPAVQAAVKASGQQQRILMLGERSDVDVLLAAADVSVLPTDSEGLPISVLEAIAAGVPVVASAVPGVEWLGNDVLELVPPGSASALAEGLRRVLIDDARRQSLVAAGRALAVTRFSSERMCGQYRAVYERIGLRHAARRRVATGAVVTRADGSGPSGHDRGQQ